ncbi:MAG: protein kinase, partial [Clostridiales bacterium]|nr:protein kinase [Clostridiales bacterium]
MIGKLFNNRYLIQEKLGSGGTAIVYKGQDTLLNRMVTVKILREEYASNDEFVRRFRREAQAVASLSHGNIVAVYDVGYEENMHYIVMEFVEGQSLKEYIKEKGALPVHIAAAIMMQVLDGIGYAHEHSIIHRDIKPHNILLGKDGRAKVTDFGIAVGMTDMTQTYNTSSRIMGSVHYIAPEQVQGQPVAEKSDIYSAGVVFYEMLTGQLPFTGDTPISI